MNTCDIDKLRDLVRRQHRAKNSYFAVGWGGEPNPLPEVDVERQVNTYLAQGTTVAALTKCVETVEAEAKERIKAGREAHEERERKERILRVCNYAMDPKSEYGNPFNHHHTLGRDVGTIRREIEDA